MSRSTTLRARGLWPVALTVTVGALVTSALGATPAVARAGGGYRQVNLVSDQHMRAPLRDTDLVNAWGLAASPGTNDKPGSPLWVADNGTDKATLYAGTGPASVAKQGLVVRVRGMAPTGQVFNPFPHAFMVRDKRGHTGASLFLFDTENGTIDGWSPGVGAVGKNPSTTTFVAHRKAHAIYKGLALGTVAGRPVLYATNFHSGKVEAYNGRFHRITLPGGRFVDPHLPANYGPFGIAEIGGRLVVTYAKQAGPHSPDELDGPGLGIVDVFSNNGRFLHRLVSHGPLDAPWGVALAPAGFGQFSGDLLVGNFGNGRINAFSPSTGALVGQLRRLSGGPVVIPGLWGLMFGNGNVAKTNELVFSAGPGGEAHGLLGKLVAP
ncbi:MAG TPA: TIGR03118 family protein [Streptosporangiaceae bacterium]|nr:TIGR03118 family protein [Streptosporangiaceae bacterium]